MRTLILGMLLAGGPVVANAVEFTVPVEAAGLVAAVKSIRVSCIAYAGEMTVGSGSQFVSVNAGSVKQTVNVKIDIPLSKAKMAVGYSCAADRAFEMDVAKLNPVPAKYLKPVPHISEGMEITAIGLQANSVVKVSGKM
jgi:hypothetical protein